MSKPVKAFRVGYVSASIFINEVDTEGGPKKIRNVNLQRRYRDTEGEWQTSTSFGLADLPQAISVLQMAMEYVASKEADVTPS